MGNYCGWYRCFAVFSILASTIQCHAPETLEPEESPVCPSVTIQRDSLVTNDPCGGCDNRCWISTDQPTGAGDIISSGVDQNSENVEFGTIDAVSGVILSDTASGPDSDGDGLTDGVDPNPFDANGDIDSDGVPDSFEAFIGTDMYNGEDMAPSVTEEYVVLPYEGPAISLMIPPDVPIGVRSADVYFLIDTTSSMTDELTSLQLSLSSIVVPGVEAAIEDVHFGVGYFKDYGSEPYRNLVPITDDTTEVQSALNVLTTSIGLPDYAESQTCALHAIATGSGLGCGVGPSSCASGLIGYPCFRPEAQPIIVLVTDAEFHNGVWDDLDPPLPSGTYNDCYEYSNGACDASYACLPLDIPCPPLQDVVVELQDIGAKVVGIWSGWPNNLGHVSTWSWGRTYPDFNNALDIYYTGLMTDSVNIDGMPFLYGVATNGSGIGSEVVNAIDELVNTMLLDVSSTWRDPDTDGVDSSVLITDVEPTSCTMCSSIDSALNIAYEVHPGSDVNFEIELANETGDIPPTASAQEFEILVEILADDTSVISNRVVHVLVPGTTPLAVGSSTGRYWHLFNAHHTCVPDNTVKWVQLNFESYTPSGTSINYSVRTADYDYDLPTATSVPLFVSPFSAVAEISLALEAASLPTDFQYLLVEAELMSSSPDASPVLSKLIIEHYCL